jgi:hypothetical protein
MKVLSHLGAQIGMIPPYNSKTKPSFGGYLNSYFLVLKLINSQCDLLRGLMFDYTTGSVNFLTGGPLESRLSILSTSVRIN